jgi:hypothetical protein
MYGDHDVVKILGNVGVFTSDQAQAELASKQGWGASFRI